VRARRRPGWTRRWPPTLLLCAAVGLRRGLVPELFALLGCFVAFFAAGWAAPPLAAVLPVGTPGGALNHAAALVLAFLAGLLAWWLLARLPPLLLRRHTPSAPERALAAGLRGLPRPRAAAGAGHGGGADALRHNRQRMAGLGGRSLAGQDGAGAAAAAAGRARAAARGLRAG
jgi:hypothetical protein